LEYFVPKEKIEESRRPKKPSEGKRKKEKAPVKKTGVLVRGEEDVMIRYAKCCNPVPGDEIIGFISRGRGVIIHKADCANIIDFPESRIIEVEWDVKEKSIYSTRIMVLCSDRKGVLASITTAISNAEANISGARISTTEDQKALCEFELEINDLEHLKKVMRSVESTRDVISVERVS
jgi:guanosine-3',5'-bis(diphosphate) 3'-pyrophosphohydrolase